MIGARVWAYTIYNRFTTNLALCMMCFKQNGDFTLLTMNGKLGVYNVESGEMKNLGKISSYLWNMLIFMKRVCY